MLKGRREIEREIKKNQTKKSKDKIKRMNLKPLRGTQLVIKSYLAASARNANLDHELGRDERRGVRLTFKR